jgi:hypothetical protein
VVRVGVGFMRVVEFSGSSIVDELELFALIPGEVFVRVRRRRCLRRLPGGVQRTWTVRRGRGGDTA